ncbi:TIGR01244 family sulfur transferase [Falsiruegeria mediterranea]|uniref:Beta-lactamase hydrolase-like protein n=1 Tax=Falsiruegeria mediterranea M17 TaxID=1200281 RepID=A0A2R8C7R7_9RHOB|nr:TIGR01244 family sulfur transferase [Falsiruegeria mediterranea]SPJ28474.1 Beta-lactamase hydrolase-like protein [Falsiruegeria mediterranea M17]
MDIRPITDRYSVSPQISVEDVPAIAEAGYTKVICNRPNAEVPPSHQADAIEQAVRAAGMEFEVLELTHQTMSQDNVARQREMAECGSGKVLAYCASGTRCSVVWALGQCQDLAPDEILSKTSAAGYQLDGLRPTLEQLRKG